MINRKISSDTWKISRLDQNKMIEAANRVHRTPTNAKQQPVQQLVEVGVYVESHNNYIVVDWNGVNINVAKPAIIRQDQAYEGVTIANASEDSVTATVTADSSEETWIIAPQYVADNVVEFMRCLQVITDDDDSDLLVEFIEWPGRRWMKSAT